MLSKRREMLEKKSYVVSRSENEIVYKSSLKHDSPLLRVSPIMAKLQIEWTKGEPFPNGHTMRTCQEK